jgi:hypothetical protein
MYGQEQQARAAAGYREMEQPTFMTFSCASTVGNPEKSNIA